jgi:hypothetical protein
MTGVSYLICFSFLVLFDFPSSFLVFSRQSFLCVSTCWWSGKPLGSLTRFFFVPLAFHPPPPPSPCLFVCLPFFVYSIRIPAGYTTSLGVCVCVCVFSPLCCCSSIHLFFGPIFINYLSCVVVWHSVYRWEKMRLSQTVYISSSLLNSHRKKKWFVRWGEKKWSIAKFNLIFLKKWTLSCIWLRA